MMTEIGPIPREPSSETELKFSLSPEGWEALCAHPALRTPGQSHRLVSVYYDTPDYRLRDRGLSLRVRAAREAHVQTVKRRVGAGRVERDEWEQPVGGARPDPAALAGTPVAAALDGRFDGLVPLFGVDVTRTTRYWTEGDALIEVSIDEGEIVAAERREPVRELELELKRGDPERLFALAQELSRGSALRLSYDSKGDRGYRLSGHDGLAAQKAERGQLPPGATAAQAFRRAARGCLAQISGNAEILLRRRNPEALHQLRVGLRRLRASYSAFRPLLAGPEAQRLKAEARWLAGELNAARDLDVFLEETFRPAEQAEGEDPTLVALGRWLTLAQAKAYERALAAVESDRFARLLLDTAAWVEVGDWRRSAAGLGEAPAQDFARPRLERLRRRLRKVGARLRELDAAGRHDLRIEAKKMRYATEFLGEVFGEGAGKRRRLFLTSLKRLQTVLGQLNDIAVARAAAAELMQGAGPRLAFAAGVLVGQRQADEGRLLAEAERRFEAFARAKPYWT